MDDHPSQTPLSSGRDVDSERKTHAGTLSRRIIKGSGVVFLMMLGNISFGFLVRITLARRLSLEEFGLFYALFAFLGLVGLLKNLGLNNAVIKYIPEFLGNGEEDKVKTAVLFTLCFSIITSLAVAAVCTIFSGEISLYYFHDPMADRVLRIFLVFFIVSALVSCINSFFNAFQRPLLLSYSGFFVNLMLFLLVVGNRGLDIIQVSWYNNAVYMAVLVFNILLFLHLFNLFRYRTGPVIPVAKKLVPFGLATTASTIMSHTTARIDTIFLTFFQNLGVVGVYSALTPFTKIFKVFGSSISKVFFPITSELQGKGQTDELKTSLGKIHRHVIFLLTPVAVVFMTYTDFIIGTIFGKEFVPGANAARIIVISALINPISIINVGTINGLGFPFKNTVVVTVSGFCNILFNLILIPLWGYNGAAMATFLEKIVIFSATHFYLYRIIRYRPELGSIGRILLIGMAVCLGMVWGSSFLGDRSVWVLVFLYSLMSLAGILVYLGLCIFLKVVRMDDIKRMAGAFLKR